jgi:hypothetical protein
MENLTQMNGVVKPNVPPAPQAGYKVVVFENTRGGKTFRTILNPGDSPIKVKSRFFAPPPNYISCAVNSDINQNFDFETQMTLAAQHQYFTLKCTVYFYITSPKLMALVFETDPIKRIKEEIERRLKKNILQSKIKIQHVQDNFYEIKEKILSYNTLNQLREFAGEFGVIIKEVNMTYKVPEKYLKPGLKEDDYFLEQKTAYIDKADVLKEQENAKEKLRHKNELRKIEYGHEKDEKSHQNQLKDMENVQDEKNTYHSLAMEDMKNTQEFRKELPKRLLTAIDNAIGSINSPESLSKVANESIEVIKRLSNEIQNPNRVFGKKQITAGASEMKTLMPEETGPFDEAKKLLMNILTKIKSASIKPEDKKSMLSYTTHLLGELDMEEHADPEVIKKYLDKLIEYSVQYRKIFTRDVMEQIKEFKEKFNELFSSTQSDTVKT